MAAGFFDKAVNVLGGPLKGAQLELLQVNLGYLCNMSCRHCHVEGGASGPANPDGSGHKDQMVQDNIAHVLHALTDSRIKTLDLTGGAPELHPSFKEMVSSARRMNKRVIVRTNLTVLLEQGMEDMPEFFAHNGVELVASLPCYSREGVDRVRGHGAFQKSIAALLKLNALGYGVSSDGDGLVLNLVYNPQGAFLAPPQQALEADYKRELSLRQGVKFNSLYTFANMPIGRFKNSLERSGQLAGYIKQLTDAFNPCALKDVMCRRLISVGPDGRLYDCDFNQALGLSLMDGLPGHISRFDYDALSGRTIKVDEHCHGCVAGQGST